MQTHFPQHVISRFEDFSWSHVPLIYRFATFLWGYLKSRVCTIRPRTIEKPKFSNRQEIAALPQEMERAMQDFEERLRMCVRQEGRHITDIIFHT